MSLATELSGGHSSTTDYSQLIIQQPQDIDAVVAPFENHISLPVGELRMLNRVLHLDQQGGLHGKGRIVTEMDLHEDLWFFKSHFPGDPIMPGCLVLECLWQSLGILLALREVPGKGRALGVGDIRLLNEILPSAQRVEFEINIKRFVNRGFALALADGVARVNGEVAFEAEQLKIGIFPDTKSTHKKSNS